MRPTALLRAWLLSSTLSPAANAVSPAPPADRPRIVDVVCFVRGVEPRNPRLDLVEPVRNQLALAKRHRVPITFLFQYDALLQPRFTDLLRREQGPSCEIGGWLEVVQPLAEAAGLQWRGRAPWDPAAAVDLTIGYAPAEREKLVDAYMKEFRRLFGRLPRTVGSWALDAHTLGYLADRYGVIASCICKEQIGNDGYTLWGGYWGQAYYPSRRNAFMPAQDPSEQIPIAVFRMAGSDPIEQFGLGLGGARPGAITLEPACAEGGGTPSWVRWYLGAMQGPCLTFAFAQAGQENAYGWAPMAAGLLDQFPLLARQAASGMLRVETLEQTARWYRSRFATTPATAVTASSSTGGRDRTAVWYDSRFYRAGMLIESDRLTIRDLHLFDQGCAEPNLAAATPFAACRYETLPVMDGLLWGAGIRPVLGLEGASQPLRGLRPRIAEVGVDVLSVAWPTAASGTIEVRCRPAALEVSRAGAKGAAPWALEMDLGSAATSVVGVSPNALRYQQGAYPYALRCSVGRFCRTKDPRKIRIVPEDERIVLN